MHTSVARDSDIGMIDSVRAVSANADWENDRADDRSPSWRSQVLRIDRSVNGEVVYRLSGRMDNENIAELESLIGAEPGGKSIILDLKNITLAGQECVDFFARCEAADIKLANCPPYVRVWIARQRCGKKEEELL